jgi:hypothetical protein
MHVEAIWRYPVKSMAGEPLTTTEVRADGIPGDRIVHVEDERAYVVTSRTKPRLLLLRGALGTDGEPTVDGLPWRDPAVADRVVAAAGPRAHLVRYQELDRFDIHPLLVATDGAVAAFGHDVRRLRPNILIGGVAGLAERGWEGKRLRVGTAIIRAVQLRPRCVMTTYDPDTAAQDRGVFQHIRQAFDGKLALDCTVEEPGRLSVGDPVQLLP